MSQGRFQVVVVSLLVVLVGLAGIAVFRIGGQPVATAMGVVPSVTAPPKAVLRASTPKPATKKMGVPLSSLPNSHEAQVIIVQVPGSGELLQEVDEYQGSVFPYSSAMLLTDEGLSRLDDDQLRIARNEIYARHGCVFSKKDLQTRFNAQPWYQPIPGRSALNFRGLSSVEQQNVDLIKKVESRRKT